MHCKLLEPASLSSRQPGRPWPGPGCASHACARRLALRRHRAIALKLDASALVRALPCFPLPASRPARLRPCTPRPEPCNPDAALGAARAQAQAQAQAQAFAPLHCARRLWRGRAFLPRVAPLVSSWGQAQAHARSLPLAAPPLLAPPLPRFSLPSFSLPASRFPAFPLPAGAARCPLPASASHSPLTSRFPLSVSRCAALWASWPLPP